MPSMNRVILAGHLGHDPELRQAGETPVCNFSLATNEGTKDKERTEWHRIVVFGKQAENCSKYLTKGRAVFLEGRIQSRSYEGKDGQKKTSFEIIADRVQFLGGGEQATSETVGRSLKDIVTGAGVQVGREPGSDDLIE